MTLARHLLAPVALFVALAPAAASATPIRPFSQAAFAAAQKQNRPILIFVHAPWCPVCRSQMKTIDKVTAAPAYKKLVVFRIDFDTQKPVWQRFGATQQSTLIGYHGKRETSRIAHETDAAKVGKVIADTLT